MSQQTGNDEKTQGLADGNAIPMLGRGVWRQVENRQECVDAVRWALEEVTQARTIGNETHSSSRQATNRGQSVEQLWSRAVEAQRTPPKVLTPEYRSNWYKPLL